MDNIKNWYKTSFPKDEMGDNLNSQATFKELKENIPNIYDYLNIFDSIIRERVFKELANRINTSYDIIYNKWIDS